METAIIGLPLAGKTTLFNALTGLGAQTAAYAQRGKGANVAEVQVPDERVEKLAELFRPRKTALATVRFKDLQAELTPGGSMSAAAIAELRTSDAIALVLRAFAGEAVPHPLDRPDPLADFTRLLDSLVFSDFAVAEKRMERLAKEGSRAGREHGQLEKASRRLEEGRLLDDEFFASGDRRLFSGFNFLTAKPIIVVANTGERSLETGPLEEAARRLGLELFRLHGLEEMEIARLDREDQQLFLEHLGVEEPARNRLLRAIYSRLDLISFLTAGEDEVRAWSIPRRTPAVRAAGRIHTDLEKGFIRAEVVEWDRLLEAGGFKEARNAGVLRLEGKDYPVRDGDVLTIRFNL